MDRNKEPSSSARQAILPFQIFRITDISHYSTFIVRDEPEHPSEKDHRGVGVLDGRKDCNLPAVL
jgi:hypothetical protein